MKISLIGMAGSGKTHWAKRIEDKGYKRYSFDELIKKELGSPKNLALWMGQPYEKKYSKTSAQYLEVEKKVIKFIISELKKNHQENIVVETTGSLIYLDSKLLKELSKLTKIVYLETPESVIIEMFNLYLYDPKPVIWGDAFSKKSGESNKRALQRSYYDLLKFRLKKYRKLANITLDYHLLRSELFNVDDFLEVISD